VWRRLSIASRKDVTGANDAKGMPVSPLNMHKALIESIFLALTGLGRAEQCSGRIAGVQWRLRLNR
jgi:hypothetical protein